MALFINKLIGKDEELRLVFVQLLELNNIPQAIVFDTTTSSIGDIVYIIEHLNGRYNYEKIITKHNINSISKNVIHISKISSFVVAHILFP